MKLNKYNTTKDFAKDMGKSIVEGFEEGVKETPVTEQEPEEIIFEKKTGKVHDCTSLYVRSAAHSNATPVDTLNFNDTIDIIGEDGDFWQIENPEGFVMKKYIKII